ncbi:hypothetical protein [Yinghuangia soli]|uniref:Uncharacterized protein n=1 Tax=Yinghuangia soli TaxID=2908204 RepID=A0AA41PWM5_9ACTN|nr:hypothetical protein [Yinghuangia soli]MCF2526209.1 hypothetical protein [Yinghuangia soli]
MTRGLAVFAVAATGLWLLGEAGPDLPAHQRNQMLAVSATPFLIALGARVNSVRIRRTLSRHPWRPLVGRFESGGSWRHAGVTITDPVTGATYRLNVLGMGPRHEELLGAKLWYAGDPRRHVLLSRPGGREIFWVRNPRIFRRRRPR